MKITANNIAKEMMKTLEDFAGATTDTVRESVREVTKEARTIVKQNANSYGWDDYTKSIDQKVENTSTGAVGVVFVRDPDYRRAHLLEHGHAVIRGGKRVGQARPFPHFEQGQEHIEHELIQRVKEKMR